MESPLPTLGIVAGSGHLPRQLAEACIATKRPLFVLMFDESNALQFSDVPHAVVRIGAIGEALEYLRRAQVGEIVLAGSIKRPSFLSLRPDATGAKLLARMGSAFFAGDDALLKAMVGFLEEEGFRVIGADSILHGLLAPSGILGKITPSQRDRADIAQGFQVAKILGQLDIGQAVIVENGYVLAVEAAEGTDALLDRCAPLKREARGGVLVKAKKPSQETRADLPAIGPHTVEKAAHIGLSGIAIEAGGAILLDKETIIEKADQHGVFVAGIEHDGNNGKTA